MDGREPDDTKVNFRGGSFGGCHFYGRQEVKRLVIAALLVASLSGCTNSDIAREQLRQESEDNYGVMRTVTAYSVTGEQIGQWYGKIDVQYVGGESRTTRR